MGDSCSKFGYSVSSKTFCDGIGSLDRTGLRKGTWTNPRIDSRALGAHPAGPDGVTITVPMTSVAKVLITGIAAITASACRSSVAPRESTGVASIAALTPSGATAGEGAFVLTILGEAFVEGSTILWNGTTRGVTFVSKSQLTTPISAADIASNGTANVSVVNTTPQGKRASNSVVFTINAPVPAADAISPDAVVAGGGAFTLTFTGDHFLQASLVQWNGDARSTTFVTRSKLTASISAADIAVAGVVTVTATSPTPGGGTTSARTLTIGNPAPTLNALDPGVATIGDNGVQVTLTGTGFVAGSVVELGPIARSTQFVDATKLVATFLATDLLFAGETNVTVVNGAPGGGTSNSKPFTVNAPAPIIATLVPSSVLVGSGAFVLSVNGNHFVPTSKVNWGNAALATTYVGSGQLTALVPASDSAVAGLVNVTVFTPSPGGGSTEPQLFTVTNPQPTLTLTSPTASFVGDAALLLTVTGTGFVATSAVSWNLSPRTTRFVNGGTLTAALLASDLTTAGTFNVAVTNPAPGGGTSGAQTYTVGNRVPTATSISPTAATVGDGAFTLTVSGTNFVNGSTVGFAGSSRPTSFVNSAEVTATITASDLSAAGTFNITVATGTPGGGTSGAQTLTVNNPAPSVVALSPNAALAGSGLTLTVSGAGFVSTSVVQWAFADRPTTYVNASQLTAAIFAGDLASSGSFNLTVTSPKPGGGTSSAATFTVNNPVPTTTSLSPSEINSGVASFILTVNGTNFVSGSTVSWAGVPRTTTFVNATEIRAAIGAQEVASVGMFSVAVTNPAPGGGTSNLQTFTANNPAVTISGFSPSSALAGASAFPLTINGAGFVAASSVQWNGAARPMTFIGPTQLIAAIAASDVAGTGTFNVTVTSPPPGGGTSAPAIFSVTNPVPTALSISPASASAGAAAFTITYNGTNFVAGSTVSWAGTSRTTSYVSATQLTATIGVADLANAGTFGLTVTNDAPGGGTSGAQKFTVNNRVPTTASMSPNSISAGAAAFTLTVNGTNFVNGSTVVFSGTSQPTTFVNSTQLTALIPASDLIMAGLFNVTVATGTPGGGTSDAQLFTVNNLLPTISSISPAAANAGDLLLTLTVNGTNFVASSTVQWAGASRTTTYVSGSKLTAVISTSDLSIAGTFNVTVDNPSPGGGTSGAQTYTVNNLVPTLTNLTPAVVTDGNGALTLTVNGTSFVAGSTVNWAGASRTTTYVNASSLTAAISTSDLSVAGTFSVTVTNPAPGGGPSGAQTLTVNNPVPTTSNIIPIAATAGASAFTLTVNGTNFVGSSTVRWAGASRTTTYVSATQLTASIAAADVAGAGSFSVTVFSSAPGGGTTGAQAFLVNPAGGFLWLDGADATTITKNGSNQVSNWADKSGKGYDAFQASTAKRPNYGSTTQNGVPVLSFTGSSAQVLRFPSSTPVTSYSGFCVYDLPTTMNYAAGRYYPLAFGGVTNTTGLYSLVEIGDVSSRDANGLNIAGGFGNVALAAYSGISSSGVWQVLSWVSGSTHNTSVFSTGNAATITNPGSDVAWNFTLGSGSDGDFGGIGGLSWDGHYQDTNVAEIRVYNRQLNTSERQLIEGVLAWKWGLKSALPSGHPWKNTAPYNVAPTMTNMLPTFALQNASAITLTVNGTNFASNSIVNWGGAARTTTYVNPVKLTAAISTSDFNTAATTSVTVTTPAPGGTSAGLNFSVSATNPVPAVTSLNPTFVTAGASAFTLTVNGTNFIAGSMVNWAGSARTTTFVNETQITATINTADIATAGSFNVTVTNGTPGGGTSGSTTFSVRVVGLVLWLDAADATTITKNGGNAVSNWADKSGNGYNATQAITSQMPNYGSITKNGSPVLSFTAANSQILFYPNTPALSSMSVFAVFNLPSAMDYTNNGYFPINFGGNSNTTGKYTGVAFGHYASGNANGISIYGGFGNDAQAALTGIANSGVWQVLDWVSGSTHTTNVWSNGTAATMTYPGGDVAWNLKLGSGNTNDFGGIGGEVWGTGPYQTPYVDSYVAEIRVYNRQLTTFERQLTEGQLAWKWGLQASLPSGHPYKNSAP